LDSSLLKDRIERLRQRSGELFFIENPIDIFYLTGMTVSRGILCIYPKGERFFIDNRYLDRYKNNSVIEVELSLPKNIEGFLKSISTVIIDPQYTSVARYKELKEGLLFEKEIICERFIEELRMIKDQYEIASMKKSAKLASEAMEFGKSILKEGVEEKKVVWEIEKYCREHGSEEMAFHTIVAFGENTAFPHYTAGNRMLKRGDAVLIDLGVTLERYTSDMTRSFLFKGYSEEYEKILAIVKEGQEKVLSLCKAGVSVDSLGEAACAFFQKLGVDLGLKHAIGHSLGLEVHEYPRLPPLTGEKIFLKEGMVIAIEPGLYFEGKFGVRIEDTILVLKNGYENFTSFQ
jgi:Xaa-Pro aminopeptidase